MGGRIKKIPKRAYKVARQRREMSPDQYQIALQTALQAIPGICGYYWRKSFCTRGDPSVRIIVMLGYGMETAAAAEAAVEILHRELDDMFANMSVVVTVSSTVFWTLREFIMDAMAT